MAFKRKKFGLSFAGLGVPLLTVAASLGGVYMGQRMIALGESNKVIREQLALAYSISLDVPELALSVNMSSAEKVTSADSGVKAAIYNDALKSYRGKITEIKKINSLYVDEITGAVETLSRCSDKFISYAANHMLLERRDAGMQISHSLISYRDPSSELGRNESLNVTADARVKCEVVGEQLNETIAKVMKDYI
ncbi:hypothetical protein D3C77_486380 [compost metagenome]